MMKRIFTCMALSLCCAAAMADGIASLKALCPSGKSVVVGTSTRVSGVVVSDCHSENMALNPNVSYAAVDVTRSAATAYVQEADGSAGVKIVFDEASDNSMVQWDRVTLDLKGCTVKHSASPDRVEVTGLTFANVAEYAHGTAEGVVVKQKALEELTDSDIYTLTTVTDLEFIFKDGSYTDIYDGYSQPTEGYTYSGYYPNFRMDGWAALMRNGNGRTIYLLVNTRCKWRRDGRMLPQGTGSVTAIIDYCPMRRYGGAMGRYSLRPLDDSGIALSKKNNSQWKLLTGWVLDGSNGQSLDFEVLGNVGGLFKEGKKGDRVLNDSGKVTGYFWTDSDSYIHIDSDLTGLTPANRGYAKNSAIMLKGKTSSWFDFDARGKVRDTRSIFVEVPTKKAKGTAMTFSFSWLEGNAKGTYDYNYPGEWKVQVSLDEGHSWSTLRETATGAKKILLRSHPWWDTKIAGSKKRTGYDCGLGMQQRSWLLPKEAFGKSSVILRLTPASDKLSAIRSKPHKDVLDPAGVPTPGMKNQTFIRFGKILIEYR